MPAGRAARAPFGCVDKAMASAYSARFPLATAGPTAMSVRPSPQIFVSYSHHDTRWREQLFADYVKSTLGVTRIWTDASLRAGDEWEAEIERRLKTTTVAVLLVSPNFLKSNFISTREYPQIMKRASEGKLRVVWVPVNITREKLTQERAELAALQGASGFDDALPAEPGACPAELLKRLHGHIRDQLRLAIDRHGADLAESVQGRYEVLERIGDGNLAAIYKARDVVLGRFVAIKKLKDDSQRESFMADVADAVRTSELPNFINVYDAAREESAAYCVLQHVQGRSLQQTLHELRELRQLCHADGVTSAMPVQALRRVFVRLVGAVARAHERGITYGNIKPSNIMLDEGDEPVILPMGRRRDRPRERKALHALVDRLQQHLDAGRAPSEADQEDLAYLVPDHFSEHFEPYDAQQADQYMLGLLAYEMATGQRPRRVADAQRLLQHGRAAFDDLPSVLEDRPLCPQRVAALIARMTSVDPAQRFARLSDVLAEPDLLDDLGLVVARDSYRRCTGRADFDPAFFARFYDEFRRRCPGAAPFFDSFGAAQWQRQRVMLKEAVLLLLAFAQQADGGTEPGLLSRIADSHPAVPPSMYPLFLDALVATVCGDPQAGVPAFDPQCQGDEQRQLLARYWRGALAPGIDYLRQRAERALEARAR